MFSSSSIISTRSDIHTPCNSTSNWQSESEGRTVSNFGLDANLPAVCLNDQPTDCQAQSGATGSRTGNLHELVEDVRQVLRWNTLSRVRDRYRYVMAAELSTNSDFALPGVTNGVYHQVGHDSFDL